MTTKHYLLIARALRLSRPSPDNSAYENDQVAHARRIQHAQVCTNIMEELANENPLFNRSLFLHAIIDPVA